MVIVTVIFVLYNRYGSVVSKGTNAVDSCVVTVGSGSSTHTSPCTNTGISAGAGAGAHAADSSSGCTADASSSTDMCNATNANTEEIKKLRDELTAQATM